MASIKKKGGVIGSGIKTERDQKGFVSYSCSHRVFGSRKEARKHYIREHLGYKFY